MIFPRKNNSDGKLVSEPGRQCIFWVVLLSCFFSTHAGVYTNSSFSVLNDGIHDSGLLYSSGLQLRIDRDVDIKVFGDSIQALYPPSIYSDVIASKSDTFTFFYILNDVHSAVYRRDVRINGGFGASQSSPVMISNAIFPKYCYLHADKGESGFLVSYVRQGDGLLILQVATGTAKVDIDSSPRIFSSQCHMVGDTFLVVYSNEVDSVKIKKIYAKGSVIQVTGGITVDAGALSGNKLMNCSIASDGNGGILVAWSRGIANGPKKVHYRFYDNNLKMLAGDSMSQLVGDGTFYYYDDVSITSLDSMRFAMVHWDITGLWLSSIYLQNGNVHRNTSRIVSRPQLRHATIASNKKYCIIACNGDVNGDGIAGIEGFRFDNNGGVLQNPIHYSYSREVNILMTGSFGTAINGTLDTSGSFAVTWRHQERVQGSVFSKKAIRNRYGFWISPVESLSITSGDSVRFQPAIINVSSLTSWDLYDSIRVGATGQACQSAPWISLSNQQSLYASASTHPYFQYKMKILRKEEGDSVNSPVISSITIPWNVKPQLLGIDSIKIGNGQYYKFTEGGNITVMSRSDSVRLRMRLRDPDNSDIVYVKSSWPSSVTPVTLAGNTVYDTSVFFPPVNSDTSVSCSLFVWDINNWHSTIPIFQYTSRNSIPQLTAVVAYNDDAGIRGSRNIALMDTIMIHENDSCRIEFAISDSNDQSRISAYLYREYQGVTTVLDSLINTGQRTFIIRGDTAVPSYSTNLILSASDPDTTMVRHILFSVNHTPVIDSLYVNGTLVNERDSVRVLINESIKIELVVHDTDCSFGDTIRYRFKSAGHTDSSTMTSKRVEFSWIPQRADTNLLVTVHDRYGKSDSLLFYIKYPWLETDSSVHNEFTRALDTLNSNVSLIIGNANGDTVYLPVLNSGKDTLHIYSIQCKSPSKNWLQIGIPVDTGVYVVDFVNSVFTDTIVIGAGEQKLFPLFFSTGTLLGDSTISDTLTISTNDSSHHYNIPVHMEYNDLPRIVSIAPEYSVEIPWRMNKRLDNQYVFPPHASVSVQFSEPVDSISVQSGMKIYSVIDSSFTGNREYVDIKKTWSQNYTKLQCRPVYQHVSPAFNIKPPEGLFIPTDIIAVQLSGRIVDKANTPSGPNALDVNVDFNRDDSVSDTIIRLTVDSIGFSVITVTPALFDTHIVRKPSIALTFSSSVYTESIDRTLIGNRTLIVRSKYNNGEQLDFDSVNVQGRVVTFRIARKLFYNDSVWCWYNSATVKNQTGFPTDNDHNGISIAMFDSMDRSDDLTWSYRVKNITVVSTDPGVNSIVKAISPMITINFSDTIDATVFDTDTASVNRSIQIRSKYSSELSAFTSIDFLNGGKSVGIQPKRNFFSKDSIYCRFLGFKGTYRYSTPDNLPVENQNNFSKYEWSFFTGNTGFYTYPNPYTPSTDPRHCIDKGPCGIWFKNLHILKEGVQDVEITIYSMNTHPVFNSKKAGHAIHFENSSNDHLPQWLWNTRNQYGELVASGLYLYIIRDLNGTTLMKGKLMIVR